MVGRRTSPPPPADAEVRRSLGLAARGGLGCATLAISGLAQVLGLALLLVAIVRGAIGEEGWGPTALLGGALLAGGLLSFRRTLRAKPAETQNSAAGLPPAASESEQEWSSGRLHSRVPAAGTLLGVFAAAWTVLALPLSALLWKHDPPPLSSWRADPAGLAVALLPSIALLGPGLLLAALTLRLRLVHRRYGPSIFEMRSVPGLIGGRLEGRILTGLRRRPRSVRLRLVCSRVVWSEPPHPHLDSRYSERTELWSEEREVPVAELFPGPRGSAIPVAIDIPKTCRPTERRGPREQVFWTLRLDAEVPLGVDLEAAWVVPVFESGDDSTEV